MPQIYKITCEANGKSYIGKTMKTFEERYPRGDYGLETHNKDITRDMIDYGRSSFTSEILHEWSVVPDEILDAMEKVCIVSHKTMQPTGYNKVFGSIKPDMARFIEDVLWVADEWDMLKDRIQKVEAEYEAMADRISKMQDPLPMKKIEHDEYILLKYLYDKINWMGSIEGQTLNSIMEGTGFDRETANRIFSSCLRQEFIVLKRTTSETSYIELDWDIKDIINNFKNYGLRHSGFYLSSEIPTPLLTSWGHEEDHLSPFKRRREAQLAMKCFDPGESSKRVEEAHA